jgi:hypothetical protein
MYADELFPGREVYHEGAAMGLEALMFVCALANRPDYGLEIAKTARNRDWVTLQTRQKLARAYVLGTRYARFGGPGGTSVKVLQKASRSDSNVGNNGFFSKLLNRGLEKSIEAELGVLFQQPGTMNVPQIRVQFTDPRGDATRI